MATSSGWIDPFVCPRGHHAVRLFRDCCDCETCRRNGLDHKFSRDELVDLREEP